jgi:hypothetical protein
MEGGLTERAEPQQSSASAEPVCALLSADQVEVRHIVSAEETSVVPTET